MVSKYDAFVETTKTIVGIEDTGISDVIKQKQLEAELDMIESEYKAKIEDVRNAPSNKELKLRQAKAELESTKKELARNKLVAIQEAENAIKQSEFDQQIVTKQAELDVQRKKDALVQIKEIAAEEEERGKLGAEQEYDDLVSSMEDHDKNITHSIKLLEREKEAKSRSLKVSINNLKIKNDAIANKVKRWEELDKKLLQVSLAIGDAK